MLVLQVSKLTTVLLRACRTAAGASSWDPLVAGVAVGKLVELEELDPMVLEGEWGFGDYFSFPSCGDVGFCAMKWFVAMLGRFSS
jgi:hypothetical protein